MNVLLRFQLSLRLPQTVSFEEGALVEPLSVAIHACNRAEVSPGQTILICGSGEVFQFTNDLALVQLFFYRNYRTSVSFDCKSKGSG